MSDDNLGPPPLHPDAIIRYDETWKVSICRTCKIGVHGNALRGHLTQGNHSYRKADWAPILKALDGRPQPMSKADFPRPPHNTPPIPDLQIWDGFACNLCEYVITSQEVMHLRHRKAHPDVPRGSKTFYRPVKVQVKSIAYEYPS